MSLRMLHPTLPGLLAHQVREILNKGRGGGSEAAKEHSAGPEQPGLGLMQLWFKKKSLGDAALEVLWAPSLLAHKHGSPNGVVVCPVPPPWRRTCSVLSPVLAEERGTLGMCPGAFSTPSPPPGASLQGDADTFLLLCQVSRQGLAGGRTRCLQDGEMAAPLHRPDPLLPETQPGEDLGGRHDGDILQQMPFHH